MASERGWHDEGDEGTRHQASWPGAGYLEGARGRDGRETGDRQRQALYRGWGAEEGLHRGRGPRGYRRSDARILEDVSDRLMEDRYVDASEIEVRVEGGEVTLSGMVDDRGARRRAEDLALDVPGVTHVQNNIRLRQQGTTATLGGYGTPVAAAYGLDATPSADAPRHGSTSGPATIGPADTGAPGAETTAVPSPASAASSGQATMRTIMALFDSHAEAERAADRLTGLGIAREAVSIIRGEGEVPSEARAEPQEERGLLASLAAFFLPAEDRHSYEEGIRRGGALLAARVPESLVEETIAVLETVGAVDLDERIGQWRATGWKQYEPMSGAEAAGQPGRDGRRRVRSYAAEEGQGAERWG